MTIIRSNTNIVKMYSTKQSRNALQKHVLFIRYMRDVCRD